MTLTTSLQETFRSIGQFLDLSTGLPSRLVAQVTSVNVLVYKLTVIHDGRYIEYVRDPSGTALQTEDGATWSPADKATLHHWGAVGDAAVNIDESFRYMPTGDGTVTGTDNYAAILAAVAWCSANRRTLWVPDAKFRVQVPDVDKAVIFPSTDWFDMRGMGGESEIIGDDNRTYNGAGDVGQLGNVLFGTSTAKDSSTDNDTHELFRIYDVILRGTWWREHVGLRDYTWTAPNGYRLHMIGGSNCQEVDIQRVTIKDALGMASISSYGQKFTFKDCQLDRIAGDGIRAVDFSNIMVHGNRVLHCDDDSIALPADDNILNADRPRRRTVSVVGNTLEKCEGPIFLGASDITIADNHMFLCYGTSLAVVVHNSDAADKGEGGSHAVTISGNRVLNHLAASTRAVVPDGTWGSAPNGINLIGSEPGAFTTALPIGDQTGDPTLLPWYNGDLPWGSLMAQDVQGVDGVSGYRSTGFLVFGNTVMRTLPEATNYSDWGYGQRFTRWGFDDPQVLDAHFADTGIQVSNWWDGLVLAENYISGITEGAGISFPTTNEDHSLRNVVISGGVISNCKHGIYGDAAGGSHPQDVTIRGVTIDLDPFRLSSDRAAGNKWASTAIAAAACVRFHRITGVKLIGCTLKNAANPYMLDSSVSDAGGGNSVVRDNIGVVDFGAAGTNTTHADNRGLGRIHPAGPHITYEVLDLDPASATFREPRDGMEAMSTDTPTTGYYVQGHMVHCPSNNKLAMRKTTGTGHTVGTDWVESTFT